MVSCTRALLAPTDDWQQLRQVTPKRIFETPYQSPQPPLLELKADDWQLAIELPMQHRRRRRRLSLVQADLLGPDEVVAGRDSGLHRS
jgi:hypothetical protein